MSNNNLAITDLESEPSNNNTDLREEFEETLDDVTQTNYTAKLAEETNNKLEPL